MSGSDVSGKINLVLFSFSVIAAKAQEGAPPVVGKAYEFVLWLLPKVENFPRTHRFTMGDRLTANGLDLLTALVEAAPRLRLNDPSRRVPRQAPCSARP